MEARVPAVLEVLRGRATAEVAARFDVDVDALASWVRAFVEAGTAEVTDKRTVDSTQLRDRFLAAFAHEVRTPLSMTLGWIATLADGDVPPDQARESLTRLHGALDRLAERTFDVELLAEEALGWLALAPQLVTVSALVEELEGLDGIEGLGGEEEIVVDPALMRKALRDLWRAAAEPPTPRGRRLEVRRLAGWLELRIHRDGRPLDPDHVQGLFAPFDVNEDGSGVRIGLHLARALVAAHGGSVGAEDGIAFWVRLPVGG